MSWNPIVHLQRMVCRETWRDPEEIKDDFQVRFTINASAKELGNTFYLP